MSSGRSHRRVRSTRSFLLACAVVCGGGFTVGAQKPAPLPVAAALAAFQLEPGLRIELVAAEPLVVSPVAFAFDGPRRLYVVEARGYPDPIEGQPITHLGRIARLEDTDGDGRFDRRTEFATGFTNPNGIVLWRGGMFITCAPDIFYLKDTNDDGIADERRVVLTGFDISRTSQIRVSSPLLGLDGKIYVACGVNGGKVTSPEHPERAPVVFSPMDGRFDPDTLVYETIGGRGQFGQTFDSFGQRFTSRSRDPVQHTVLDPLVLKRNPHLAFTETMQGVSKNLGDAKVFPISRSSVSADFSPGFMGKSHAGTFTSACGLVIFGGSALTPDHVGNVFICEPAQNLVQRQVMQADGASFRSDTPYSGKEFLATTDVFFRPVFLGNGPDGALYIADMHRREIDHPSYVPEEPRGRLDFEGGKGAGRIYRIVRSDYKQVQKPEKATSTAAECVTALNSPDSWWRERAQRLLLERPDAAAVPLLEKILNAAPLAEARVRALWTLQDWQKLSRPTLLAALQDKHARVREQALTMAADRLATSPELSERILALAEDPDARVRMGSALALGSSTDPRVIPALAKIAIRDGADRWTRVAVLSGIGTRTPQFLDELARAEPRLPQGFAAVMEDLGRIIGASSPADVCRQFMLRMLTHEGELVWRIPSLLGLAEGMRGRTEFKTKGLTGLFTQLLGDNPSEGEDLELFFRQTAKLAMNEDVPARTRAHAVALLAYGGYTAGSEVVATLLSSSQPREVQLQAMRTIDAWGDRRGADVLTLRENWVRYTPQLRETAIAALVSKPSMTPALFAALKNGTLTPAEISSAQRARLLKHSNPAIRTEAEKLFQSLEGSDRLKVYQSYRSVLAHPADARRGQQAFARVCSVCHSYDGTGGNVGPDLTGIRNQPADALLLHILVPNAEVAPGYQAVTVTTKDGRTLSGWLSSETDSSLSLRTSVGTEETILRSGIATLSAPGLSLMPDGLEQTMTREELADLIAYLRTGTELSRR